MSLPTWVSVDDHDWLVLWFDLLQTLRILNQRAAADALRSYWTASSLSKMPSSFSSSYSRSVTKRLSSV